MDQLSMIEMINVEELAKGNKLSIYPAINPNFINELINESNNEDYDKLFQNQKGLSDLFVQDYSDRVKLISKSSGYAWTDKLLWEEKDNCHFVKMIMRYLHVKVLDEIGKVAKRKMSDNDRTNEISKLSKLLYKCQDYTFCEKVFKTSQSELMDIEFPNKLNNSPNELPIKGGKIIDLKTLKVRGRYRTDFFSFELDVDYLKNDKLEHANKFFSEVMGKDEESIKFLQKILGYSMTGETDLRSFFIFWGKGSNGKSVINEFMRLILKSMYTSVDKRVFLKSNRTESHTEFLMPLLTARFGGLSEVDKEETINENLIKKLTGNDPIDGRALYGRQMTFKPKCKYFMLTNNKPKLNVNDEAAVSRCVFIEYACKFVDNPTKPNEFKKDTKFIEDLQTKYLNEVFTWLCIGANNYYNNRILILPKKIQDSTNGYINEQDKVQDFINDNIESIELSDVKRSDVFKSYENYCTSNGYDPLSKQELFKDLEKKGFELKKTKGEYYYKNLKFIEN